MLGWVRADDLDLENSRARTRRHIPPAVACPPYRIDTIGNDGLAEIQIRFREPVSYEVADRTYILFEPGIVTQNLFNDIDTQECRTDLPSKHLRYRSLAAAR